MNNSLSPDWTSVSIGIFVILLVVGLLFVLLRRVNTWYWKIDRRVVLQEQTNFLLKASLLQRAQLTEGQMLILEMATGLSFTMTAAEWNAFQQERGGARGYWVLNEASPR